MSNLNELESQKKLKNLISVCYEKYKSQIPEDQRELCEEYLYIQGEYELALSNFLAVLKVYRIELDLESARKINEAKKIMNITEY